MDTGFSRLVSVFLYSSLFFLVHFISIYFVHECKVLVVRRPDINSHKKDVSRSSPFPAQWKSCVQYCLLCSSSFFLTQGIGQELDIKSQQGSILIFRSLYLTTPKL